MLVVSEFVGCSPSVSGAIRVNPWSIDSLADGIYTAIKMPASERHLRHDKHWRYVSQHTVRFWAQVGPVHSHNPPLLSIPLHDYTAIRLAASERHLRYDEHLRYVLQHTVRFWAQARPQSPPIRGACKSCVVQLSQAWLLRVGKAGAVASPAAATPNSLALLSSVFHGYFACCSLRLQIMDACAWGWLAFHPAVCVRRAQLQDNQCMECSVHNTDGDC